MKRESGPLAVGAAVVALGLFFLLGARTIAGEAEYAGVGPRVFPTLVGVALVVLGVGFLTAVRRGMAFPSAAPPAEPGAIPWIVAGVAGATALVEPLGFPLAAALLFVLATRGFGSRRWARNALLGAALGVVIYLAFARALGISLPGGVLDLWARR